MADISTKDGSGVKKIHLNFCIPYVSGRKRSNRPNSWLIRRTLRSPGNESEKLNPTVWCHEPMCNPKNDAMSGQRYTYLRRSVPNVNPAGERWRRIRDAKGTHAQKTVPNDIMEIKTQPSHSCWEIIERQTSPPTKNPMVIQNHFAGLGLRMSSSVQSGIFIRERRLW